MNGTFTETGKLDMGTILDLNTLYSMANDIGVAVGYIILEIASLLTSKAAPGLVVIVLLSLLGVASIYLMFRVIERAQALDWFYHIITSRESEADFGAGIAVVDQWIKRTTKSGARSNVATAWSEYRETLIPFDGADGEVLRNSTRPHVFFNLEDLGFGAGFWRILPGLFVTVGLFLTFLGLISALGVLGDDMNASAEITQNSMAQLLTVASAKFIMSLTGLFCSIVFTIVLRVGMGRIDRRIHMTNAALESRLSFISLEDIANDQLNAIREQRDHIRAIGLDLVATLADRLTQELPDAIGKRMAYAIEGAVKPLETLPAEVARSLQDSLGPIMEKVGHAGSEGMGDMVRDLSSRFSDDVSEALGQASTRLAEAGDGIGDLIERMNQSSSRMGGEMETAVVGLGQAIEDLKTTMTSGATETATALQSGADQLLGTMNETLQGIRENTAEGASAMREAAGDMREAAKNIRQELEAAASAGADAAKERMAAASEAASEAIGAAGVDVSAAFGRTSGEIARLTSEISDKAGKDLFEPLESMTSKLEEMVTALSASATEVRRASVGIRAGADASTEAAGSFRVSAQVLVDAADPVRSTVDRMEGSTKELVEGTRRIAETARENAASIKTVIEAAQVALASERDGVQATLTGIGDALERLRNQGQRLDDMDEKLGAAFDRYTDEVKAAVDGLFEHVRKMQEQLAPAVDTLREVVEQAEQFAPQSRPQ